MAVERSRDGYRIGTSLGLEFQVRSVVLALGTYLGSRPATSGRPTHGRWGPDDDGQLAASLQSCGLALESRVTSWGPVVRTGLEWGLNGRLQWPGGVDEDPAAAIGLELVFNGPGRDEGYAAWAEPTGTRSELQECLSELSRLTDVTVVRWGQAVEHLVVEGIRRPDDGRKPSWHRENLFWAGGIGGLEDYSERGSMGRSCGIGAAKAAAGCFT